MMTPARRGKGKRVKLRATPADELSIDLMASAHETEQRAPNDSDDNLEIYALGEYLDIL